MPIVTALMWIKAVMSQLIITELRSDDTEGLP